MDIVAELLEKAETQGYLSVEDVLEALASLEENESAEVVMAELRQAGIEFETVDQESEEEDLPLEDISESVEAWDDEMLSLIHI